MNSSEKADYTKHGPFARGRSDSSKAVTVSGLLGKRMATKLWHNLETMPVVIRIDKKNEVPLHQQITAQIEYLIATGSLKAGDSLPSVRTLARQLRIHHNTVSQAYKDLTA